MRWLTESTFTAETQRPLRRRREEEGQGDKDTKRQGDKEKGRRREAEKERKGNKDVCCSREVGQSMPLEMPAETSAARRDGSMA